MRIARHLAPGLVPSLVPCLAWACLALFAPAAAQEQSIEDKLRDALRQTTVQLRALQDSQGQLQAQRDSAVQQRDALQRQLADLQSKQPAQPAKPPPDQLAALQDRLGQLTAALETSKRDNAALSASNQKWQAAYRQAADIARQKNEEAKLQTQNVQKLQKTHDEDLHANQKLATLAGEILHLYRSVGFRRLLLGSYEPLLGFQEVKLENLVQDYEDKIYDLRIFPPKPMPLPAP